MKKSALVLLMITVAFAAFVGGFYLGRNYNHSDIEISVTQATLATTPPASESLDSTGTSRPAQPGLININTATLEQLDSLPGIGLVRAQAIIDYRNEYGPFTSVQDLLNISGIGEKTLEKLLDYITVGG